MLQKEIKWFRDQCILACDGKCHKAWGINNRPKRQLSEDEDDYEYLSDNELGEAPENPGTYEGGQGKNPESLNKWCARECERSKIFDMNEQIALKNFENPVKNIQS